MIAECGLVLLNILSQRLTAHAVMHVYFNRKHDTDWLDKNTKIKVNLKCRSGGSIYIVYQLKTVTKLLKGVL